MDSAAAQIFVSHSSTNRAQATELAEFLSGRGMSAWVAYESIPGGRDWADQIVQALRSCKAVVVLVSERANASDHVSREIHIARSYGKPILPVRLEDVEPARTLEYDLALLQRVDAFPPPFTRYLEPIHRQLTALIDGTPMAAEERQAGGGFRRFVPAAAVGAVVLAAVVIYASGIGRPVPTATPLPTVATPSQGGVGPAVPAPKVVLETVEVGADQVRAEGTYENLVVGRDNVLLIGQPSDLTGDRWLPVAATLDAVSESAGFQSGRWNAIRPTGTGGQAYRWFAVIAPTGSPGSAGPLNDLNQNGPASEFAEAVSEQWLSP